jgi:hypothetical protein
VTATEECILDELKAAHQRLLQKAVVHTTQWSLDAVETDWSEYRQKTKVLAHQWLIKAREEQALLLPLIEKYTKDEFQVQARTNSLTLATRSFNDSGPGSQAVCTP